MKTPTKMGNVEDKFFEISGNLGDLSENINSSLEKLTKRSIFKKIYQKFVPSSSLAELENVYEDLEEKEKKLREYHSQLLTIKETLENENVEIDKNIVIYKTKMQECANNGDDMGETGFLEVLVSLESKKVNNTELITNQIPVLTDMIRTFLGKISKTLPFLKMTLRNQIEVSSALKTLSILIESVQELEKFSMDLEKANSAAINSLTKKVHAQIVKGVDVEYYKEIGKRNAQHKREYEENKLEYKKKLQEMDKALSEINSERTAFIEMED